MLESFTTLWNDVLLPMMQANMALVAPLVFLLGLGESLAVVSLFIPSTALFLAIGAMHSAAGGEFLPVWLAGASGAFLGDLVSYAAGRYFRRDIGGVWPFRTRPEWYVLARTFCAQWGGMAVVASKFLGAVRPFVPVVAGAMEMRFWLFAVASAVSALMWAGVFLAPGYGLFSLWR